MPSSQREALYTGWLQAVSQAKEWGEKQVPDASPEG
jgi:hypothetical protein